MKPRILLVGYGRIGKRHAEHITTYASLKGIVETDLIKLKEAKKVYGDNVQYFTSLGEISIFNFDVAAICTPNGNHFESAKICIESGLHVLVEKPITLKVKEAIQLLSMAEKLNKRVFAVKQNRFNPPVEYVKNLLQDGALGKVHSFQLNCFWNRNEDYYLNSDWKGTMNNDGGVLYTQFSHFVDLLIWLLGDMKVEAAHVSRENSGREIEIEDSGVAIYKSEENSFRGTLNYTINSFRKNMEGSLTIFGERGTVKIGGQYLNELEYFEVEGYDTPSLAKGNSANNYGSYTGSMSNHDKVYENLVDVLVNDASIKTSGIEAVKSITLIQETYEKAGYWN